MISLDLDILKNLKQVHWLSFNDEKFIYKRNKKKLLLFFQPCFKQGERRDKALFSVKVNTTNLFIILFQIYIHSIDFQIPYLFFIVFFSCYSVFYIFSIQSLSLISRKANKRASEIVLNDQR